MRGSSSSLLAVLLALCVAAALSVASATRLDENERGTEEWGVRSVPGSPYPLV